MFALYIYTKNPYIFYAFIIFFIYPPPQHVFSFLPLSANMVPFVPKKRKQNNPRNPNTPPFSPIAILMPPLHFLCSRRKRDTCRLRKTFYASMLQLLPFLFFPLSLSLSSFPKILHPHPYTYNPHTYHLFKNYMFFCRKQSKIKIKPVDVMIALSYMREE